MEKLITKLVRRRSHLEAFEGRVNEFLDQGWKVKSLWMEKHWFKMVCHAVLEAPVDSQE